MLIESQKRKTKQGPDKRQSIRKQQTEAPVILQAHTSKLIIFPAAGCEVLVGGWHIELFHTAVQENER